jgi:hypothetical protein
MTSSKIDAPLLEVLREGATTKLMVSMTDKTEEVLRGLETRQYADRAERLNTINQELTRFADQSQAPTIRVLEEEQKRIPITWKSMWISNQLIVEGADLQTAERIAAIPNVESIEGEKFMQLHKSLVKPTSGGEPPKAPEDLTK